MRRDTLTVHAHQCKEGTRSVSIPIYQTTTYENPGLGADVEYSYSRCSNPTRAALQEAIAALEGGVAGFAFSSGLAAETAVFSLLSAGDHVVISDDVYGGTYRQTMEHWARFGVEFTAVDPGDTAAVESAVCPETRMIFIETPTNPMMKVADISAIAGVAKAAGALLVVDNTFLTPYFQKPIALGADIVVHSATKFLSGHHDTMAGLVVTATKELAARIDFMVRTLGAGLSPMDAWLTLRGIKTLALRMERHNSNAAAAAEFLKNHPAVDKMYFVGDPDHPSYEISKRQASGFGGMISFTLRYPSSVGRVLSGGRMIMFAESLGGVETLITYPKTQTHASIPPEICAKIGITDALVRLSVGIENPDDIIADLKLMLEG